MISSQVAQEDALISKNFVIQQAKKCNSEQDAKKLTEELNTKRLEIQKRLTTVPKLEGSSIQIPQKNSAYWNSLV